MSDIRHANEEELLEKCDELVKEFDMNPRATFIIYDKTKLGVDLSKWHPLLKIVSQIKTKNDALLNCKHGHSIVRRKCKQILKGEK